MMVAALKNTLRGIFPTELELKKENNSNCYAYFLDLHNYIESGEFNTRFNTR